MIRFYQKASNNAFVLGGDEYSYATPGQYYAIVKGDYLAIFNSFTDYKQHDSPYSEYAKEDGSPYESITGLMDAVVDFFASPINPPNSTGGYYFVKFLLTGTDGDFTGGARSGSVKIFTLPDSADLSKDLIVFDGLTFTNDYTTSIVSGHPTVIFTNAPMENSFIYYQTSN